MQNTGFESLLAKTRTKQVQKPIFRSQNLDFCPIPPSAIDFHCFFKKDAMGILLSTKSYSHSTSALPRICDPNILCLGSPHLSLSVKTWVLGLRRLSRLVLLFGEMGEALPEGRFSPAKYFRNCLAFIVDLRKSRDTSLGSAQPADSHI